MTDRTDEARYRVKFTKTGEAKWLSHLDLARFLERSIRRAGLPIAYSNGFSPHPKISFGQALSVGVESCAEYVDLTFDREREADDIKSRLSAAAGDTISLLNVIRLGSESKKLGKVLRYADYKISMKIDRANAGLIMARINSSTYLTSEGIQITSEDSGPKTSESDNEGQGIIVVTVRTPVNVSPKKILNELQDIGIDSMEIHIMRIAQWSGTNEEMVDPIKA